jgi:chromosomal replication initiation ATPase DnaA
MSQRDSMILAPHAAIADERATRADVWAALQECAQRQAETASREQVLRELLDDAHRRIRGLEAALERVKARSLAMPERAADLDEDWSK